ncbi:uncharacterized protein LOC126747937 [Anthonomus grandis grandis]|uniref:uncharacterized protein LOC126747937 n=1 Tax=Anthonomus grandis grandis TaxID=2921223 RepID=UPI0021656734|nr:uncharacterized protein LOC126747937 [Anthonomus grandis grandis]
MERHQMGNLPVQRITPTRPFYVCGADYAGPFLLRDRRGRKYNEIKAYISLFVCFSTKAIHLEVVSDLTSECFLASLRRFASRRGKPYEIHSDNGSTYVGAKNELYRFFDENNTRIHDSLLNDGIQWRFITPRAPHQGGLWEAGACLNSRPLCSLSQDPCDATALTPAHFIIGDTLTAIPDHDFSDCNENRLLRYQRLQRMLQHFWTRWAKEYVSTLQERVKWKENCQQMIKVGALVICKEDGLPPLKWRLGRIIEVHPGSDGIVRSVTFKTSLGVLKRPVVKLCVLPID